jgi:hypothetical protein
MYLVYKVQKLIKVIRKSHGYENSEARIVKLVNLVDELCVQNKLMNKELDIVHHALAELYNYDVVFPTVKKALAKIERLYKSK